MQKLSNLSPMSWGLEGFLDVFLRNGDIRDVLPKPSYCWHSAWSCFFSPPGFSIKNLKETEFYEGIS